MKREFALEIPMEDFDDLRSAIGNAEAEARIRVVGNGLKVVVKTENSDDAEILLRLSSNSQLKRIK